MITVAILLLAHLLGDFPLQTNKIFKLKNEGHLGLTLHVTIHLIVIAILIQNPLHHWPLFIVLGIAHYITDWSKLRLPATTQATGFFIDQLAHVATIFLIGMWIPDLSTFLPLWLLVPALTLAAVPAVMTFVWVWANEVRQTEVMQACPPIEWASSRLLPISQQMGLILVLALTSSSLFILF